MFITLDGIDGMVRWHFVLDQTCGHVHFGANRRYLGTVEQLVPARPPFHLNVSDTLGGAKRVNAQLDNYEIRQRL